MNTDLQYWLFDNLYDCCKQYYWWEYNICVTNSIHGSPSVPQQSSPNVVLNYKSNICFSSLFCTTILNNLDQSIPIFGNAIFREVCVGQCNPGDTINFDSVCGQVIDRPFMYDGTRRLKMATRIRKAQESEECLEFTIMMYAQSEDVAIVKYNKLYDLLETSTIQYFTLQSIQTNIQSSASTNLPDLSPITITGYQHASYSVRHEIALFLFISFENNLLMTHQFM